MIYSQLSHIIKSKLNNFSYFSEFQELEINGLEELPGVVCSCFSRYIIKLEKKRECGSLSEKDMNDLEVGYELIESMSKSRDQEVVDAVKYEIFENFYDEFNIDLIQKMLKEKSKLIYIEMFSL